MKRIAQSALVAAASMFLACSGSPQDTSGDPVIVTSETGGLLTFVTSQPGARPVRGTNRILYYIESTEAGAPVDDLELKMTPFMPSHGHGSSAEPSVVSLGDGLYEFDNVVLAMPGLWEFRTNVSGLTSDYVVPRFEVD